MGVFEHFPYTNFHNLNLDWLLQTMKEGETGLETLKQWAAAHEKEYKALKHAVDVLSQNLVDPIVPWDSSIEYHIFSIVEYQGTNYIAIQDVPVGVMITNTDYWTESNTVVSQLNAIALAVEDIKTEAVKKVTYLFPHDFGGGVVAGDVAIIKTENNNIMIDTQSPTALNQVEQFLTRNGVTHVDYMLISHFHTDHCMNVPDLITDGFIDSSTVVVIPPDCRQLTDSVIATSNKTAVMNALSAANITPVTAYDGLTYQVDDLELVMGNADPTVFNASGWSDNYNECSTVVKVKHGSIESLYTGDAMEMALSRLYDTGFVTKNIDLYKIEHHGIEPYGNIITSFIQYVKPRYAFLPATSQAAANNGETLGSTAQYISSYGGSAYPQYSNINDIIFESTYNTMNVISGMPVDNIANEMQDVDLYVVAGSTGIQLGTQSHPFAQVRQALSYCKPYTGRRYIIHIADGTYDDTVSNDHHDGFGGFIGLNVDIVGNETNPENVVIKTTKYYCRYSNLDIHGVTFEIGLASDYLGFQQCSTQMYNCIVQGAAGNSIMVQGGDLYISGTTIKDSTATGIAIRRAAVVTHSGCTFSGSGSAISVGDGGMLITRGGSFGNTTGIAKTNYGTVIDLGYRLPVKSTTKTIPYGQSIAAGGEATFATNLDLSSDIGNGTLVAVIFEWSSGNWCVSSLIDINDNTLREGRIRNVTSSAHTINNVGIRILYQ